MSALSRRTLLVTGAATAAVVAEPARAAQAKALVNAPDAYVSTMSPANSGAANAAAFEADVAAANGRQILVLPADTAYTIGAVEITGETINVRFMPGARLEPDPSLHAIGGRMFHATNCNTRLYGLVVDGKKIPESCWRSDGGEFRAYDITMSNMGIDDITGNASSLGTTGILCKGVQEVVIDGYVGRDFVGKKDGVYANNAGKVNHLMVYECERVAIRNVTISGGAGEDNDFFHILDLRPTPTMHGTIESCHLYYNNNTRRCMKFQGGNWDVRDIHCYPGPDFVPVSSATDVGSDNLNCIDWAGSVLGELRLSDSFINATGFVVGISHTGGPLGKVIVENCTIVGGRRHAIRTNPEPPQDQQDIQTMGFFAIAAENESELRDCVIKGFSRSVVVQGNRARVVGNVIDDPQEVWFQGGSSTAKDFLELSGNKVYTRTAGAMGGTAITRCGRIDNYSNVECHNNSLIRVGNDTHAAVFIDITNAAASGSAGNNRAPVGTIPVRAGSSNVVVFAHQGYQVSTTTVGTVTTGEDNLQSHTIPPLHLGRAGVTVRTTFTGTTANNANAKTLRVYIGSTAVMTKPLTASQAGAWEVQILLIAVSATTQKYTVRFTECSTAGSGAPTQSGIAVGTLTLDTTAATTLKTTGEGVATNDIVGQIAVSESFEGRP